MMRMPGIAFTMSTAVLKKRPGKEPAYTRQDAMRPPQGEAQKK
jgi:hypothetical protein